VLRYRLYDIDQLISRTVSYAIVTGGALLTYAVVVTAASSLAAGSSSLVAAAATLAAAATVQPLLHRVRGVVDRRFDRARYDGALTVEAFGSRLRVGANTAATIDDLLDVVRATMAPTSAALVLTHERRARGGAP
jgi:hypothetical protein